MSDAVTALGGAAFDGLAHIAEAGLTGMILLRADLSDPAVAAAIRSVTNLPVPAPLGVARDGGRGLLWMSPDEALLLGAYDDVDAELAALRAALGAAHALAVDVSDARAMFVVSGPATRDVFAKLAPLDFAPASFPAGMIRRTRLSQVPAAIWFEDDTTARLVCFRSVAAYVFGLLTTAAAPGSDLNLFPASPA